MVKSREILITVQASREAEKCHLYIHKQTYSSRAKQENIATVQLQLSHWPLQLTVLLGQWVPGLETTSYLHPQGRSGVSWSVYTNNTSSQPPQHSALWQPQILYLISQLSKNVLYEICHSHRLEDVTVCCWVRGPNVFLAWSRPWR